ncbi:MAG: sulfite exporter TauE/SafE family protein [Tepidisphaeraceae bacterium]
MTAYLIIPLIAFLAGFINAIAGGGTFFMFPALTGLGHLTDRAANVTSTVGLWPGAAASVYAARRELRRLPRGMTIAFFVISLFGGVIGAWLLLVTPKRTFSLLIPWLLLFATLVFGFSKPIARWAGRQHGHRTLGWTIFVALVQLIVAIYGGYFGAGIGILMLAGLAFAGLDDIHQMNAMKVLLQTSINGVASIIFLFSPDLVWSLALPMALMSAAGGFLGLTVARKMPQNALRAVVFVTGIMVTGWYFVKNYY